MSALLAVKDRATFWRAVGTFVMTATSPEKIRAVVNAISRGASAGAECPQWAARLLESVPQVRSARHSSGQRAKKRPLSLDSASDGSDGGRKYPRRGRAGRPPWDADNWGGRAQHRRQVWGRSTRGNPSASSRPSSDYIPRPTEWGQAAPRPQPPSSIPPLSYTPGPAHYETPGPLPPPASVARSALAPFVPGQPKGCM